MDSRINFCLFLQVLLCCILFQECLSQIDLAAAASTCPAVDEAVGMMEKERFCYYIIKQPASWQDAEDRCHDQDHGHLMAITSQLAMDGAATLLKQHNLTAAWTGAWRSTTGWTWLTGNALGSFQPWAPGTNWEDGLDGCAVVDVPQGLQWMVQSCSQRAAFMCQLPLGSTWCGPRTPIVSDTCIYIDYGSHNWFVARELCQRMQGILVTIDNQFTSDSIKAGLNTTIGATKFWIGLRREKWTWSTDSEVVASFWKYGEPSQQGHCAAVMDADRAQPTGRFLWVTHNCKERLPSLCQLDLAPGEPEPTLPALLPPYARVTTPAVTETTEQPVDETLDEKERGKGGLTGGLVFLFLVMLAVLGGIVIFFFLYIRRGKLLRERARARAALGKSSENDKPVHRSSSDFIDKTFTASDGTVATDIEDTDLQASLKESGREDAITNMFSVVKEHSQPQPKKSNGKKEICGAHGEELAQRNSATHENATVEKEKGSSEDKPKPERPHRPSLPDLEAYRKNKLEQSLQAGGGDVSVDREERLLPKRKREQSNQTAKPAKSLRGFSVNAILDEALNVARQKSSSTQHLITTDDEDSVDSISYHGNRESTRRSQRQKKTHQRRHSTAGPVEHPASVVPQRKRSDSRTSEGLGLDDFRSSTRSLSKSRHMRAASMDNISINSQNTSKRPARPRPPANLPKPEKKEENDGVSKLPPLDARKLPPIAVASQSDGNDPGHSFSAVFDFDADGVGEAYEV